MGGLEDLSSWHRDKIIVVWRGKGGRGLAGPGWAWLGWACHGKARILEETEDGTTPLDHKSWRGGARQGSAWPGKVWLGEAGQGTGF